MLSAATRSSERTHERFKAKLASPEEIGVSKRTALQNMNE
jgi:hypothetical protein